MRDGPVSEDAATTAAGHAEFLWVDVTTLQEFVDAGHQIAIIVARIVILNDIAELLAIASRAAWVDVKDDVAFSGHPLKFMIKDPAIGGMWAAVDVENEWVLLLRIEVGRLLNPPLNALAVETAVFDFLWRGQIQLRPEFPVEVSNTGLRSVARNGKEVADHHRRGDEGDNRAAVRTHRKIEHGLIAPRDFGYCAGLYIEAHDWRASLLLHNIEERATVGGPVKRAPASATRCGIVAGDGATHIKVVIGGKVLRFCASRHVHNPQVGLRIGAHRLSDGAVKGQPAAIWTKDEIANIHRNRGEFFRVSSRGGDRVNIRAGEFVIGLVDATREKINP